VTAGVARFASVCTAWPVTVPAMSTTDQPREVARLQVGGGHELHVERWGHPGGVPAVFCHGGPGQGSDPCMLTPFDLDVYDVVLYDQRGCGRSTPAGSLVANTTDDLVADLEVVRRWAGFDSWLVSGASWGTTLALAYACEHPGVVDALVLRGVFGCSRQPSPHVRTGDAGGDLRRSSCLRRFPTCPLCHVCEFRAPPSGEVRCCQCEHSAWLVPRSRRSRR
jgi:pimeloyl-ACP methyl ester carboxylesterase